MKNFVIVMPSLPKALGEDHPLSRLKLELESKFPPHASALVGATLVEVTKILGGQKKYGFLWWPKKFSPACLKKAISFVDEKANPENYTKYSKQDLEKMSEKQLASVCKKYPTYEFDPKDLPKLKDFASWERYIKEAKALLDDEEDKNPNYSYYCALAALEKMIPENWVLIARRVSAELLKDGYLTTIEELEEKLGRKINGSLRMIGGITSYDGSYDPTGHGVRVSRDKLNRELVEGMFHVEYPETRGFKKNNIITHSY